MNTVCARATCNGRVAGVFVTNMPESTAWLVDLDTDAVGVGLCPTHLNRFSVPMGWTLIDQRSGSITSIEPAPSSDETTVDDSAVDTESATAERSQGGAEAGSQTDSAPVLDTENQPSKHEPSASSMPDDAGEPSGRWDGPERADSVSGPAAESPLLARAFGGPDDAPSRLALFGNTTPPAEDDDETLPFPPDGSSTSVRGS